MQLGASSIARFCEDNDISRSTFYKLDSAGKAPRTFRVGRRRLVSDEAAIEWRRERERETATAE